jgi:hypothetical protein
MSLKAAIWTHGNTVYAQSPGPHLNTIKSGWGTHFKTANSDHWFHFPFAAPIILDDIRPALGKIFVLYATNGDAKLTAVHIYDGQKKIKEFSNLLLQGNHYAGIDSSNTWIITPVTTIYFGLGISVAIHFGAAAAVIPEIIFYSAGADFLKS